jgi:hypothetical protein
VHSAWRIEQSYKHVKGELGWADFQVRSDRAIRRHWALVCCAFSFCWQNFLADHPTQPEPSPSAQAASTATRGAQPTGHRGRTGPAPVVAAGTALGAGLADPMDRVAALLTVVVASAPPRQLQVLLDALAAGHPLHLYIPPKSTNHR